jgi:hypothetical protein
VLCRSLHYRSDHNQVRKPNSSSTSTCSINLVSTTTKLNHIIIDCDWLKKFPLNHVGLWITCLQQCEKQWNCFHTVLFSLITIESNVALKEVLNVCFCFLPETLITTKLFQWVFQNMLVANTAVLPLILLYSSSSLNGIWEQEPLSKYFPEVTLAWLR